MKISLSKLLLMAVAVVAVACSSEVDSDSPNFKELIEKVSIAVPTAADSRTTIDPDGMTTRWATGDKLAVWAKNEAGDYVLSGAQFMMHHYSKEFDYAFFDANIPAMAEGEYTYYLSYPMPKSVNGTEVTYSVAQTQSGVYDGKYDIMLAEVPAVAEALSSSATTLNTVMRHQMHAVKITIPEGRNIFGYDVTRLEITFPNPVVGDIIFDVANPDAEPIYTNTSNTIILENSNGFAEGSDIWAFVLPGTVDGDVSYKVRGEGRQSVNKSYALSKTMVKGHITPIRMATPELYLYTSFLLSEGESYLGEDFNSFQVYDFNGSLLAEFTRNAENAYEFGFEGEIDYSQWENTDLRIVFDSNNAIVENSVNLGAITPYVQNKIEPMVVPYLFEENFDGISAFGDGHDDPANGFNGDSKNYSSLFSSVTSDARMAGWSGGRYRCESGAIRVCCRSETGLSALNNYRGRFETSTMSKLKSTANVNLRVTFTYSAASRFYLLSTGSTMMHFGSTTTSGAISPKTDITNRAISDFVISDSAGSFTSIYNEAEAICSGCTNATRLSWMSDTNAEGALAGNANFWLYVDNIKVQIAN